MAKVNINDNGVITETELTSIDYTSLLRTTASHGKLALTDQIYDNIQMKTQEDINKEILDNINENHGTEIYIIQNDWLNLSNVPGGAADKEEEVASQLGIDSTTLFSLIDQNGPKKRIFVRMGDSTGIVKGIVSVSGTTATFDIVVYYNGGYCKGITISANVPPSNAYKALLIGNEERSEAIKGYLSVADALIYKGAIAGTSTSPGAFTPTANKGDYYKVSTAGFINGVAVTVGDVLICNTDSTQAATSTNYSTIKNNWDYIQSNIDIVSSTVSGLMTPTMLTILNGSIKSVEGRINGTDGYTITVTPNTGSAKSFTIPMASATSAGLMSPEDKDKLDNLSGGYVSLGDFNTFKTNVETNYLKTSDANNTYASKENALSQISLSCVAEGDKININVDGLTDDNTEKQFESIVLPSATTSTAGVMSAADKVKLNSHESALTWE